MNGRFRKRGKGTKTDPILVNDENSSSPFKRQNKRRISPSYEHLLPKNRQEEREVLETVLQYSITTPRIDVKMDPSSLTKCPTIYWTDEDVAIASGDTLQCYICCGAMKAGTIMRKCHHCKTGGAEHLFHKDCLDWWFDRSTQCPICKVSQKLSPLPSLFN